MPSHHAACTFGYYADGSLRTRRSATDAVKRFTQHVNLTGRPMLIGAKMDVWPRIGGGTDLVHYVRIGRDLRPIWSDILQQVRDHGYAPLHLLHLTRPNPSLRRTRQAPLHISPTKVASWTSGRSR